MNSVVKGSAYVLIHAPDMVLHNGTTQTMERRANPSSAYLQAIGEHLRTYAEVVRYPPNQTYIGNMTPEELKDIPTPWYENPVKDVPRFGRWGEIMPQDEFCLLMQASDVFDLVVLERGFVSDVRPRFAVHPLMDEAMQARVKEGVEIGQVERFVNEEAAEGLYHGGQLIGCVKKAHDTDASLCAHVIHENLVSKASCVLSLLHLSKGAGVDKADVELVIDCSEEACGDMNQRGGGNMAKAAAEIAGYTGASGADVRAFCAAPVHAVIHAAALVKSGTYKNVVVAAGGSTAKLGMNGKDHVKKGLPVLEDVLGGFAVLISENDGISPEILSEYTGRHTVSSGSSPQAVITALVADPLDKLNMKLQEVGKYSVEMQNPEITKPAGAGDVPLSNYKMIAALNVMRGELLRGEIDAFTRKHGMTGWAPTQGHIPSGIPYVGFGCEEITGGRLDNCMIIGKGSLFLGRMTNLFDGCSFMMRRNGGKADVQNEKGGVSETGEPQIVLTGLGSEHGEDVMLEGAVIAAQKGIRVLYIGTKTHESVQAVHAENEEEARTVMEELLRDGKADGAVTMHYPFPVGISTVGRATTPGLGRTVYIAATTGTSSLNRTEGMVKNALYGIACAKACGVHSPTVGILNLDGARQAESALKELQKGGYGFRFAASQRADGGCIMRGNDLLAGACDVMVTDSLTGNVLIKMLGAFSSGGSYETVGDGYGPGIGRGYERLVMIVSRASGAPVIAGAIAYAAELVRGGWRDTVGAEFAAAEKAGLTHILEGIRAKAVPAAAEEQKVPPAEVTTHEITGIDILDLEDAVRALYKNDIYAMSGMGCTGPVVLVNEAKAEQALRVLTEGGWIAAL